eukprot:5121487-Pleurochrysis_carterae.AAC.1
MPTGANAAEGVDFPGIQRCPSNSRDAKTREQRPSGDVLCDRFGRDGRVGEGTDVQIPVPHASLQDVTFGEALHASTDAHVAVASSRDVARIERQVPIRPRQVGTVDGRNLTDGMHLQSTGLDTAQGPEGVQRKGCRSVHASALPPPIVSYRSF